jgi:hypothetical protein
MKTALTTLRLPAIISSTLVLPFIALELFNRANFLASEGFPFVLFTVLWLLPAAFVLSLMPIVRAGDRHRSQPHRLIVRIALLIFIAWVWGAIIFDQLPCCLGVPNCD